MLVHILNKRFPLKAERNLLPCIKVLDWKRWNVSTFKDSEITRYIPKGCLFLQFSIFIYSTMRHTLQNVITYHFLWRPSDKVSLLIFEIGALFLRSKSTNTFVKKYVTMKKAYLRTVLKWKRWIPVPTCCTPKRTNSIPDSSSGSKLSFQEQTSFLEQRHGSHFVTAGCYSALVRILNWMLLHFKLEEKGGQFAGSRVPFYGLVS